MGTGIIDQQTRQCVSVNIIHIPVPHVMVSWKYEVSYYDLVGSDWNIHDYGMIEWDIIYGIYHDIFDW